MRIVPMSTPHRAAGGSARARFVMVMLLSVTVVLLPAQGASAQADGGYVLTTTVSPTAMTAAGCATDPACVAAAAPAGGGQDDYAALQQAITSAAARTTPAVVDAGGAVLTPSTTATVLLAEGRYTLTNGLRLPPDVNLRGQGITATTLVMDPTVNWRNFSYSFLIRHDGTQRAGSANLVSDLTVNGNCRTGAGDPVPSDLPGSPAGDCDFRAALGTSTTVGGGVSVGDRWTVRQVRFTNLGYFKLWVLDAQDARIIDNRFDNWGGAESGDHDNIGGGGRNDGTVIEDNQFDQTARGNSFDFTNAIRTVVRRNTVHTAASVAAARGVPEYGNMYLEGVVGATVSDNTLYGAHITVQSNAKYQHTGANKDITNPRDTVVSGNRIVDSAGVGVMVVYDDYRDADNTWGVPGDWNTASTDPADHIVRPGGGNVIRDNTIERPRQSGVLVVGTVAHSKDTADTITGNTIRDAGFGGSTAYNTGAGHFDTAGIGISIGDGDTILGNSVVDDQDNPTTWYGVHIGGRKAPTKPVNTVLFPTGAGDGANTATGLAGYLYRYAAAAPEAPTGLTATGATLVWNEAYPLAGVPVGGYRVYRDGLAMADLPVGSASIPANLLTEAESSFESGTAGWIAGARTTIGQTDAAGAINGSSLVISSTGAGQISVYGRKVPAVAGATYTSVASFQAAGTGRRVRAGLAYTDGNGVVTRLGSANSATVDASNGWMTSYFTAVAPSGAGWVQSFLMVENTVAGEAHFIDRVGLVTGTRTEQWTDPAPSSHATYQVVAYRAGAGENSAVASVVVP